jgi:hypothetical protein
MLLKEFLENFHEGNFLLFSIERMAAASIVMTEGYRLGLSG